MRATTTYRDLAGEAFWVIGRPGKNNTGAPVSYAVIPADWVTDIPDTSDGSGFFTVRPYGAAKGGEHRIPETDVIWFRDPDLLDPYARGNSIVGSALVELTTDTAAAKFLAGYFSNSARPDLIVSGTKEHPIDDRAKPALETYWTERHRGPSKAGRPMFSSRPLEVKEIGKGLRDNEMSHIRASLKAAISEIFGVPPEIFGRIENSNRSTIDAAAVLFGRYTLAPRLKALAEELEPFLTENFDVAGYVLKF
jgi:phage portal protein BeeE